MIEFVILTIWLFWLSQAYPEEVKVRKKLVLFVVSMCAAGLIFGIAYLVAFVFCFGIDKVFNATVPNIIPRDILLSILLIFSFIDYKFGKTKEE